MDAVDCAMAVQTSLADRKDESAKKIDFRIGINVGDIIIDGDDIFGDGVNVAARVETECEPGGVCLSGNAYEQVRDKTAFGFDDLGERSLKNIDRPVRLYAVRNAVAAAAGKKPSPGIAKPLPLPDRPSIAVLPFQNMSGDPEQEYFADGMVEEIITGLSRFKSLFVIARNSSFVYKGKAADIKHVGRELGVRYVLEGSVRKAASRVRITGQLIDCATGAHLWADNFEGDLLDIFDLQDRVAISVAGSIAPRLISADAALAKRKPPEGWDSYDFYLQGIAFFVQRTPDAAIRALNLFRRAIDLNPEFGLAYIRAAACLYMRPQHGGKPLTGEERFEATQLTARALTFAADDEFVLAWAALILAFLNDEVERGSDLSDRAVAINPNFSNGWNARGWISASLGDGARALDAFDRTIRLNPADEWTVFSAMQGKCVALWTVGRHEEAFELADQLLARRPNDMRSWFFKCADPDPNRATAAAERLRTLYPNLRSSHLRDIFVRPVRSVRHRAALEEAIIRIGLPE